MAHKSCSKCIGCALTQRKNYYYQPHFTDEETEVEVKNLTCDA